ncbi:MAG: alanine dehydrogenase [Gammaproteobacteria bacterium]|nr:alanine dehydrogenase [Gammaproteobacteria bacterium]
MRIGVPKETKASEFRVGLTPTSVAELSAAGHEIWVQSDAGRSIGFDDQQYLQAGAKVVDRDAAFTPELVVKVKEPCLEECARLNPNQILFTYLHLAAARPQAEALMASGCAAIAYETVEDAQGRLPLLTPMSEVAGRMSIQVGAQALLKSSGGRGTLLGGVPGVMPGKVVILGGGIAGTNAAYMAVGMQADVTVIDKSVERLRTLSTEFAGRAKVLMASRETISTQVEAADLVIGAALIPGASSPKLIDRELLARMLPGAVVVDISIDQGGCFESSRPTTHQAPTFVEQGVVHYCVTNMPGGVARTATQALNNVTLPYVLKLAELGLQGAFASDAGFAKGLNVRDGQICHATVAKALAEKQIKAA